MSDTKCKTQTELDLRNELIHSLLCERGNARLQLAPALKQEAHLSFHEICLLSGDCLNLADRVLVIESEFGVAIEWLQIGGRTLYYFFCWMSQRSIDLEKVLGPLLHDENGNPVQSSDLLDEFRRTLCLFYNGIRVNQVGLNSFDETDLHAYFEGATSIDFVEEVDERLLN